MNTLISDKELIAYISGQLNSKETRKLHMKALANGEVALLYHAQLAALAVNEELANELLGEDDFQVSSNVNKAPHLQPNKEIAQLPIAADVHKPDD